MPSKFRIVDVVKVFKYVAVFAVKFLGFFLTRCPNLKQAKYIISTWHNEAVSSVWNAMHFSQEGILYISQRGLMFSAFALFALLEY